MIRAGSREGASTGGSGSVRHGNDRRKRSGINFS